MAYATTSAPERQALKGNCMPAPVCYLSLSGPTGMTAGTPAAALRLALPGPCWDPHKHQMS